MRWRLVQVLIIVVGVLSWGNAHAQTPTGLSLSGDLSIPGYYNAVLGPDGLPEHWKDCPGGPEAWSGGHVKNWGRGGIYYDHCGKGTVLLAPPLISDLSNPANIILQRAKSDSTPDLPLDLSTWPVTKDAGLGCLRFRGYAGNGDGFDVGESALLCSNIREDAIDKFHHGGDISFGTTPIGTVGDGHPRTRLTVQSTGVFTETCADATPTGHPEANQVWRWFDCAQHKYLMMDSMGRVVTLADYSAPTLASLITPAPGSSASGTPQTFTWNAIPGALTYYLAVGPEGGSIEAIYTGFVSATTVDVPMTLRATGAAVAPGTVVHVRLYTCAISLSNCPNSPESTFTYTGP